jgi:protein-S-isoprenylcysteine O-methyltransferase
MKLPLAAGVGLIFCLSELVIAVTKRSGGGAVSKDQNSLRVLLRVIFLSIFLGIWVSRTARWGWLPHRHAFERVGVALFVLGTALRWWSILLLGKFFTVDVAIAPDHRLVESGPYRYLRHPSYSGALLAFVGMGLTMGNVLSLLIMLVPIVPAFLWRIRIEESALQGTFGVAYRDYSARTKRLIPGVY